MMKTVLCALALACAVSAVSWHVENEAGRTCLLLEGKVAATLKFNTKKFGDVTHTITIDQTQSVEGNCTAVHNGKSAQNLHIRFFPNNGNGSDFLGGQEWELNLWFASSEKTAFELMDYELLSAEDPALNGTATRTFIKSESADLDMMAQGTHAFKCSSSGLALSNDSTLEFSDLRVIAFASLAEPKFQEGQMFEQCFLDSRTSDVVPIVVGACLAGLVVVVLVAYLVGRARAKRQGYASV